MIQPSVGLSGYILVRANFPETLLLAREAVDWGPTETAMSSRNLLRARAMAESWDEDAAVCAEENRAAVA